MITADLARRKALVTGAASGIGLGTATLFARLGCAVALNDVPGNPKLEAEVARLRSSGLDVRAAPGDVGDADGVRAMVRRAAEAMGGLDYLVNNAATPGTRSPIPPSDLDAQTEAFWQRLLSINLIGPFRCVHAAAPYLKAARGAVVNTASISGFGGGGSSSVYCATKAALINQTKEWARALGPEVRVNAIAPGMVDSAWECRFSDDSYEQGKARAPLARVGTPEDYAEAILFLCAGAGYVTGHTLVVDGGLTA
ncbi:MAG: SDR family oxidoreductase [Alphaproteobacteria bacterium]|nr:SDR family oxidoreductase [Alphaproteobacteria bacterium]